ncbi:signal recognition particle protein, partial [Acidobacteria bacterium AH-259-O06]|nr:signal recognition particle protein [Acidobacteria bacterium AH-259-O06]
TKLQKILRDLKGEGRISERHVEESMREIRIALLEADVHFKVVKEFVSRVKEKALGQEVLRSLTPGQQVVKIVRDELIELFGRQTVGLGFSKVPPSVILMVGLQGSGKTTTTGKLALWLSQRGHQPLVVSTDVYRPAAIEQLSVIARDIDIPVYVEKGDDPVELAKMALRHARNMGFDVLLLDTAGRLHIDEELMTELERIREEVKATEILMVADAMTGQDAVNSAQEFNQRLDLSGVILTKMDGDARGGAALSIQRVTGKPIKFIGVGEKYDALELFHPDRMANRILGMGDVLSLIEKAEEVVDEDKAEEMLQKLQRDEFTLEDFRNQVRQIRRLGPLEQVLGMLPQVGFLKGLGRIKVDEKQLAHLEAIINSMTWRERTNYKIINASRRKRIASGSGRPVSEVNRLLKQYVQTKKMMKQITKGFRAKGLPKLNFPI